MSWYSTSIARKAGNVYGCRHRQALRAEQLVVAAKGANVLAQLLLTDTIARKPRILDDFPATAPAAHNLTADGDGFSLECKPSVAAADRAGLERLSRYSARPAFAHDRIKQLPNGNVSYRLPRVFYTGQTHVVLPPVDFLRRLAALIPPP